MIKEYNQHCLKALDQEKKIKYTQQQLKQFFVGLMDGNGSIQCNHWKKRTIQYRLVIQMKNTLANHLMLQYISKCVGGRVRQNNTSICWVEDNGKRAEKICEIFNRWPPLTSRLQCQLAFFQKCRQRQDVEWMLRERRNKYAHQGVLLREMNEESLLDRSYFSPWTSGFIEAEGCFRLPLMADPSFSIGQKDDFYILKALGKKFATVNKVRLVKKQFYHWQVYRKSVLQNIVAHCLEYPLLGEKRLSFASFAVAFSRPSV